MIDKNLYVHAVIECCFVKQSGSLKSMIITLQMMLLGSPCPVDSFLKLSS